MNLKTGFEKLDNLIDGINKKDFIIIASRPGIGKSALAINIINNIVEQTNDKILYFNLEKPKEVLKNKITSSNVEIIDTPAITIEEIESKCEEVSKNGLSLVVIDYIQLVSSSLNKDNSNIVSYISRILKVMTLKLNIPIIILSQLSSKIEEREDKRPRLSDFRYSHCAADQDSDKIIFLYKEDFITTDVELIVAKNRGGSTGAVNLQFDINTQNYK